MKKKKRSEWEAEINMRAWTDPAFKKRLIANPKETLKEMGIPYDFESVNLKIIEEDKQHQVIVLHTGPVNAKDVPRDDLKEIAAGTGTCCSVWNF